MGRIAPSERAFDSPGSSHPPTSSRSRVRECSYRFGPSLPRSRPSACRSSLRKAPRKARAARHRPSVAERSISTGWESRSNGSLLWSEVHHLSPCGDAMRCAVTSLCERSKRSLKEPMESRLRIPARDVRILFSSLESTTYHGAGEGNRKHVGQRTRLRHGLTFAAAVTP